MQLELLDSLKVLAPGSELRLGLDNILNARMGAIIVLADLPEIENICDGGFNINEDFTSSKVYELSKMDGAIILSKDAKKILKANVELMPDHTIFTKETGTRHRTAERVAKEIGNLVICISERRSIITVFKGNNRYVVQSINNLNIKANQILESLEKNRKVLDNMLNMLSEHEFDDIVTLETVCSVIYRAELILRTNDEATKCKVELGTEGLIVSKELEDILNYSLEEEKLVIKDYINRANKKLNIEEENIDNTVQKIIIALRKEDIKGLTNLDKIIEYLGYEYNVESLDLNVSPKGYRILSKVPKMPNIILNKLLAKFGTLQGVCKASMDELDNVDGIGVIRAKMIYQSLKRMQEKYIFNSFNM